jgi:hypothetical protein
MCSPGFRVSILGDRSQNVTPGQRPTQCTAGRADARVQTRVQIGSRVTVQVQLLAAYWWALDQMVCVLPFRYGVTLRQAGQLERIPYAREPHKLPVVLGADEVRRSHKAVPSVFRPRCPRTVRLNWALPKEVPQCCEPSRAALGSTSSRARGTATAMSFVTATAR